MKVFDLHCSQEHRFEGWFASSEDFDRQRAAHMIECPLCGDHVIEKLPSATRLNLGAANPHKTSEIEEKSLSAPAMQMQSVSGGVVEKLQQELLSVVQKVLANTEDVGENFAEEARRIHYQEVPERNIRGTTSPEEVQSLVEEGIEVQQLAIPHWMKEPAH